MVGDTFLFHPIQTQLEDDIASVTLVHHYLLALRFSCLHPLSSQAGETHLVTYLMHIDTPYTELCKILILGLVYKFIASICPTAVI